MNKNIILLYYILEKETEFVTFEMHKFGTIPKKDGKINQRHNFMEISWTCTLTNPKFHNIILETETEVN